MNREEIKMKETINGSQFKERLLMEYTQIIEKIDDLQRYLDTYNNKDVEISEAQNAYLQCMGKQLEAMHQYRACLYTRIMMIMDGTIK